MYDTYHEIDQVLRRLGYLNSLDAIAGFDNPTATQLRLASFVTEMVDGQLTSLSTENQELVTLGVHIIYEFLQFPLTPGLEFMAALLACNGPSKSVLRSRCPVLYFFKKGSSLPGFRLLALPALELISSMGARAVPVVLLACRQLQPDKDQYSLTPDDILNTLATYTKKNRDMLANGTIAGYREILLGLITEVRKIYAELYYGNYLLHSASEIQELEAIEKIRMRLSSSSRIAPPVTSALVLPSMIIKFILMETQPTLELTLSLYSEEVLNLALKLMTAYGLRFDIIQKLSLIDFKSGSKLLFAIKQDNLLEESFCFVPFHSDIRDGFARALRYRSAIAEIGNDEPLLALCENGIFRGITHDDLKHHLKLISELFGEEVTESSIYQSHLYYYVKLGGLNPAIDDRIACRVRKITYIPRLYLQTSATLLREAHAAAHLKVTNLLDMELKPPQYISYTEENSMMIGGKRAVGRNAIRTIFSYFRSADRSEFEIILRYIAFLFNYFCACRSEEMLSLQIASINIQNGAIKFYTKNTTLRMGTTKSLEIPPPDVM